LRRECLLDLDDLDFFFCLVSETDTELSSSSSSSLGTGHKSRRILGIGLTSTVTGFLGISSKFEKSANSSIGWFIIFWLGREFCGKPSVFESTVRIDGVLGLSTCCFRCGVNWPEDDFPLITLLLLVFVDVFPGTCWDEFSPLLLLGSTSLKEVIDGCALLFGVRDPAWDLGEAEFLNGDDGPPCRGIV